MNNIITRGMIWFGLGLVGALIFHVMGGEYGDGLAAASLVGGIVGAGCSALPENWF